ncbi:conserved domain protein [Actinomyces sp. oral taxon 170 str. F0386]|jgi:hypothetical protein|nr:conserved domain protein [Actinomyces sp. oral taxon 170 str. F0386]
MMPMMTAVAARIEMVSARGPGRRRDVLLRGVRGGRVPPAPVRPRPNSPVPSPGFFFREEPFGLLEESSEDESWDSSSGVLLTILLPV